MTGREAIRIVSRMTWDEARTQRRTTDATLRLVCGWRLEEPAAFKELAQMAGAPVVPTTSRVDAILRAFERWRSIRDVARECARTHGAVSRALRYGAKTRGYRVERRCGASGLEWRVVRATMADV